MAQQERAIRTRRAVLNAAALAFSETGYANTTVAQILKLADVTKGALYFHFDSKEALAKGVLDEQIAKDLPPQELKLQEWIDIGMVLAYQLVHDPILRAGARLVSDPEGRARYGTTWPQWVDLFAEVLTEAQERGEVLPHVNTRETAEFCVGAYHGNQMYSHFASHWEDMEERASVLYKHVLPGITAPAILPRLDTSADRGARIFAEAERESEEAELAAAG
ncbi:ScbR family autoregulator-binding transcription factor [Streptomyces sp. NPDC059009]|uniref:ScbR family autoregulator-binding transcription factor n=1 Tax=Streptomyces sp. NPDC059009 TaxID=3346694 RepID=UPI0036958F7C